jgi:hypothetical protein
MVISLRWISLPDTERGADETAVTYNLTVVRVAGAFPPGVLAPQ